MSKLLQNKRADSATSFRTLLWRFEGHKQLMDQLHYLPLHQLVLYISCSLSHNRLSCAPADKVAVVGVFNINTPAEAVNISTIVKTSFTLQLLCLAHASSVYYSWVTKYCIQICHVANATIAAAIAKVAYSITLFQNLFCLLVISCTNIAIFFFSLSLLSSKYCIVLLRVAVYTAVLCSYHWSSSWYSDMWRSRQAILQHTSLSTQQATLPDFSKEMEECSPRGLDSCR